MIELVSPHLFRVRLPGGPLLCRCDSSPSGIPRRALRRPMQTALGIHAAGR